MRPVPTPLAFLAGTLTVFLALACDEAQNAKDRFPADIQDSLTLEEIGAAGYRRICDSFADYMRDQYSSSHLVQAACLADAVSHGNTTNECSEALEGCIETPPPEVEATIDGILVQAGCGVVDIEPAACDSTVGALKSCLDALQSEISSIKYSLTCAAVGQTDVGWDVVMLPNACLNLSSDC